MTDSWRYFTWLLTYIRILLHLLHLIQEVRQFPRRDILPSRRSGRSADAGLCVRVVMVLPGHAPFERRGQCTDALVGRGARGVGVRRGGHVVVMVVLLLYGLFHLCQPIHSE